jgi:hypothetical protein
MRRKLAKEYFKAAVNNAKSKVATSFVNGTQRNPGYYSTSLKCDDSAVEWPIQKIT